MLEKLEKNTPTDLTPLCGNQIDGMLDERSNLPQKKESTEVLCDQKSFVKVSSCVLNHIIKTKDLSDSEKLYYLINYFYINFLSGWKKGDVQFSARKMQELIGLSHSRIFKIQKNLEDKEYIILKKTQDSSGRNNVNIPIVTLPKDVLIELISKKKNKIYDHRNDDHLDFVANSLTQEERMEFIDTYCLFTPINFNIAKSAFFHKGLSHSSKLLFLYLFSTIHKIKQKNKSKFYAGSMELKKITKGSGFSYSTVSRNLNQLTSLGFLNRTKILVKNDDPSSNRFDKIIQYLKILVPPSSNPEVEMGSEIKPNPRRSQRDPQTVTKRPTIYSYRNKHKNLDKKIDKKKKNEISNEQGDNPFLVTKKSESTFLNNSDNEILQDITQIHKQKKRSKKLQKLKRLAKLQKKKHDAKIKRDSLKKQEKPLIRTLKDFYPLSTEDASLLALRASREFSKNAINEILLDMSKRYDDRSFKSKGAFMNYMKKVLVFEMRDAVKTSHNSFRIKNNLSEEEKERAQQERFLTKVENDLAVSPKDHFCKKIASILKPKSAYEILFNFVNISINKGIFTLILRHKVDLTNLEKKTILKAAKASHDDIMTENSFGRLITDLEIKYFHQSPLQKFKDDEIVVPSFPDNIWGKVKKTVFKDYFSGNKIASHMERFWFSKVELLESHENGKIKLVTNSFFIRDEFMARFGKMIKEACSLNGCSLDGDQWVVTKKPVLHTQ